MNIKSKTISELINGLLDMEDPMFLIEIRRRLELGRKAMIALESLTPSGSEFHQDVDKCVNHIRERFETSHKHLAKKVKQYKALEKCFNFLLENHITTIEVGAGVEVLTSTVETLYDNGLLGDEWAGMYMGFAVPNPTSNEQIVHFIEDLNGFTIIKDKPGDNNEYECAMALGLGDAAELRWLY